MKRREVTDAVCAAVIGRIERPEYVVVGLPVEGRLRIVGRSTALTAKAARDLAAYLQPPQGPHPWPEVITETMLNRFSKDKGSATLTLVEPLVVEISADLPGRATPSVMPSGISGPGRSWQWRTCNCRVGNRA